MGSSSWFFRFVIWDHFFHTLIHLNYWSETLRPPLDYVVAPQGANGVHLPDPVSCKAPDRDKDSKLPIHKGLFKLGNTNQLINQLVCIILTKHTRSSSWRIGFVS